MSDIKATFFRLLGISKKQENIIEKLPQKTIELEQNMPDFSKMKHPNEASGRAFVNMSKQSHEIQETEEAQDVTAPDESSENIYYRRHR